MRITIRFPDGKREEFEIDISAYTTIADVAEDICLEMAERWAETYAGKRRTRKPKALQAYVEGCTRWLYPQLVSAIIEYLESAGYSLE